MGDRRCCLFTREHRWSFQGSVSQLTEGLSRCELPDRHLVNQAKGSLLLDMPGMKCDPGNLEAWIFRHFYRIYFSSVKPSLNSCQGANSRFTNSGYCRPANTGAGAGILQPHEMPASVSDSLIQNGGCHIFNRHPRFAESLLPERESFGQYAPLAEKHRVGFHACGFLTVAVSNGLPEPGTFGFVLCSSLPKSSAVRGWLAGLNGSTILLARVERWFFTSDFLMMLMEAPVVLLLTWKVLVRSEAWTAEGEEEYPNYSLSIHHKEFSCRQHCGFN